MTLLESFFITSKSINKIDKFFGSFLYLIIVSLISTIIWGLKFINNDISLYSFLFVYSILLLFVAFFAKDGKAYYPIFLNCMICFCVSPDAGNLSIQLIVLVIIMALSIIIFFLKKFFIYKNVKLTFGYMNIPILAMLFVLVLSYILNHFIYPTIYDKSGLYLLLLTIGVCAISVVLSMTSNTNKENYTNNYLLKTAACLEIALIIEHFVLTIINYKTTGNFTFSLYMDMLGWGTRNNYATLSCFCLIFIYLLFIKNPKQHWYYLILFLIGSLLTFATMSRSGQLQIIGLYLFVLIYTPFKFKKYYIQIMQIYLAILILAGIIISIYPNILHVLERLIQEGTDLNGREMLYDLVIKHTFSNNFYTIFGGSTQYLYQLTIDAEFKYLQTTFMLAHNTYITALAFGGMLGLLTLIYHQINLIYKTIKYAKDDLKYFMLMYLVIIYLLGIIENSQFSFAVSIPLILLFADLPYKKNIYVGYKYKINLSNQVNK